MEDVDETHKTYEGFTFTGESMSYSNSMFSQPNNYKMMMP